MGRGHNKRSSTNKYKSPKHPNIRNRVRNPELKNVSDTVVPTCSQQFTYAATSSKEMEEIYVRNNESVESDEKHVQNTNEDNYTPTTVLELTSKNINFQQHNNSENGNRSESYASSHLDDDFSNHLANLTSTPKNDDSVDSNDGNKLSIDNSKSEVSKLKSHTDTNKNDKGHNTFIPSSKKNGNSSNGTPVIFPVLTAAVFTATLVVYLVFHSLLVAGITAGIGVCVIAIVTYYCSKPSGLVEKGNIAQVASSDKEGYCTKDSNQSLRPSIR